MKFRSLMFKEFRLSIKGIALQAAILLAWIAIAWGMLFSSASNGLAGEELQRAVDSIIIMTALIGLMYLLLDENFKSDINSGWLGYSYALPVKPLERAAARFVRRFAVNLGGILFSLCNAAAVCAYTAEPFGANQIIWHIVVFAAVIMVSLPNDIFMLRARNGADMKKMRTVSGMATTALMIFWVIVIFKVSGDARGKLVGSEVFELPVFTAGALAWAVPLLLAMMAASFWAAYFSLRSAYSNAAKSERGNTGIRPAAALTAKTSGAKGLLYKELKQNRLMLIFAALTPVLLTAFPFCFSAIEAMADSVGADGMFGTAANGIMRVIMCVAGIFIVSALMSEVFRDDDKKLWAYFVISAPQGVKGFLYRKYAVTLMMNLIYMVSGVFADNLLATAHYFVLGKELTVSMQSFYLSGVFLLMGISAFDIPFTVRYGSKRGSMVKMVVMLSICGVGIAVFGLLPDAARMKLTESVSAMFNGEGANDILRLISSFLPYIAFAAFLYSYKIACRVFMKGVNEYDK